MDESTEEVMEPNNTDRAAPINNIKVICDLINSVDADANIDCEEISERFESGEINYDTALKEVRASRPEIISGSVLKDDVVEDIVEEEHSDDTTVI